MNLMGPVKAALAASCRYLAHELGPRGIRVHAISPGPLKTLATSLAKRITGGTVYVDGGANIVA